MVYQYILGGVVIASLVGFFILFSLGGRKRIRRASMEVKTKGGFVKISRNGDVFGPEMAETGTDVVIVGAGVAGAALAYTLGKVNFTFFYLYAFSGCHIRDCN